MFHFILSKIVGSGEISVISVILLEMKKMLSRTSSSSLRTQTHFWLSLFSAEREKRQPEIRLRSQAIPAQAAGAGN